ncbi:MAG: hypothetical protein GC136_08585 [Alphaproteobacteria bacterium]|nr:hypothetical protein [Alphaproteobacteria bacterium]
MDRIIESHIDMAAETQRCYEAVKAMVTAGALSEEHAYWFTANKLYRAEYRARPAFLAAEAGLGPFRNNEVVSAITAATQLISEHLGDIEMEPREARLNKETFALAADILPAAQMRLLEEFMVDEGHAARTGANSTLHARQSFERTAKALAGHALEAGRMDLVAHISQRCLQYI